MGTNNENLVTKDFFNNTFPLSERSFNELQQLFCYKTIDKNEVFLKAGRKNNMEYFIVDGYCRSFLVNPDGDDITLAFFKKHDALSPQITRTKNDISLLNFQALTTVELVEFDAGSFLSLMINNMEVRNFGNTILKDELMRKTDKEISLASLTARERLAKFREEYAELENLIPHPIIASYLGITNVSLSRLRSDASNK